MMPFGIILQKFMDAYPIPVMTRILLERVLSPQNLNALFNKATKKQYTRNLLFSTIFELMNLVVFKVFPSINSVYQMNELNIGVSIKSVYNKLNGLEPEIAATLVRDTGKEFEQMIKDMQAVCKPLLPGYRIKILDGNCIEASEHRLSVLRDKAAGALPGKSLVIFDPQLEMVIETLPCEDGHAQERSLLNQLEELIEPNDVWVEDRNFCVRTHLFCIASKKAFFISRHHKQVPYTVLGVREKTGTTETGDVYEQQVELNAECGNKLECRCIIIRLNKKTRNGDDEIILLTNLPKSAADAITISNVYRKRWNIETAFQQIEKYFHSEINTLGYPKAALFGFCIALVAYNILAVIKAALRHIHDEETINEKVSGYYIAGEIARIHEGMEGVIESCEWEIFQTMPQESFIEILLTLAKNVKLEKYKKSKRGVKKKSPERQSSKNVPHVSTFKLLSEKRKM